MCAWARPDLPFDSIADLPLGEITASLLRARAAVFGEQIRGHVDCEECGQRLELTVLVGELLQPSALGVADAGAGIAALREVNVSGIRCRLPSLRDLAAVASERDMGRAARQMLTRLIEGSGDNIAALSEVAVREIEDALETADPNADLALEIHCDACGHLGVAQLDAGELLWEEIDVRARGLLAEVDMLARAYGWTESEILGLSAKRRASYLSMVSA
jgi:hypothetical protein